MRTMTFKNTGEDFSGYHAATKWLDENGYSYGSMQAGAPTAIAKGDIAISKWRNIPKEAAHLLDGQIEPGDFQNADVTVTFKD